jgi:hypothetical protein
MKRSKSIVYLVIKEKRSKSIKVTENIKDEKIIKKTKVIQYFNEGQSEITKTHCLNQNNFSSYQVRSNSATSSACMVEFSSFMKEKVFKILFFQQLNGPENKELT